MKLDIEETLSRELREVADAVEVPALPALPDRPNPRPVWQPLLVAAAVLIIVLGAVATFVSLGDDGRLQPAPAPSPTQATEEASEEAEPADLTADVPAVPYILGPTLFVAGQRVPGEWFHVEGTDTGWFAVRNDGTYWWGNGPEAQPLEGTMQQPPVISPDGRYLARVVDEGNGWMLTGAETVSGGEGFGGTALPAQDRNGAYTMVAAVTDDGLVITRGDGTSVLWRPLVDGETVDLAETAPDQVVMGQSTDGRLVVVDGSEDGATDATQGAVYLADVTESGELVRAEDLPNHDDLIASAEWLAWVPPGTIGGEVTLVASLDVQRVDGSAAGILAPPQGWSFRVGSWKWEEDDRLVATVARGRTQRLVRCDPVGRTCLLIDAE